jgi:hypothetical protein
MQYDPLIEILNIAEHAVEHAGKSAALRNLQTVLRADQNLSRELQRRMATLLRTGHIPDRQTTNLIVGFEL